MRTHIATYNTGLDKTVHPGFWRRVSQQFESPIYWCAVLKTPFRKRRKACLMMQSPLPILDSFRVYVFVSQHD